MSLGAWVGEQTGARLWGHIRRDVPIGLCVFMRECVSLDVAVCLG